jgi:hypothetical protein
VTLDLVGRVPTPEEYEAFVADSEPRKRSRRVDALLASEEWSAYWAEVYTDLLVGRDINQKGAAEPMREWLNGELGRGEGWDDLVDAMVTAEGPISKTPASAFIASNLRAGGPETVTGAVSRKFLGVQIECAQCHDHPYDEFSREDFWGMAAFFSRTKVRLSEESREARKKKKQAEAMGTSMSKEEAKKMKVKRDFEVWEKPRGEMKIYPKDAEGQRGPEKVKIAPAFMGEALDLGRQDERREALSQQMLESPLLARAAVGFVWTQMMGRGITSHWDDLPLEEAKVPALLDRLADEFVEQNYDLRWLQKRIVSSAAYARSSQGAEDGRVQSESVFARAAVRPLSSDQLFRSLLQATGLESVANKGFAKAVRQKKRAALQEFAFVFNDDEMLEVEAFSGNVPQALLLFNGRLTNQAVVRRPGNTTDLLLKIDDDEERVRFAYRSVYAREAGASEIDAALELVGAAGGGASAWEDFLFAMLNSTEFLTNH